MAQFDLALPKFGAGDLDDEKQRRKIMNYLVKLDEQLRFVLNNLDTENFTETFQQVIISGGGGGSGESSESLKALQEELNRLSTKVMQTANEIALKASAEELNELGDLMRSLNAEFKVLAGEISTKVSKEEYDALKGTVDSHSTSIKQTADEIELKADKSTVDALSGTVSEHSAQFKVTAEQISSTVKRVDTLNGTVNEHSTAITQTAEKIESTAKAVQTLDGKVEEQSTRITQTAEKIESKAEKAVVDELGNAVSRHESTISQTPEQIRMAVESVQVGGTNMIRNTGTLKTANHLIDESGASARGSCTEDEFGGFHVVCKNENIRCWMGEYAVTPGQSYAMSVRYKMNSGAAPIQFQYVLKSAGGADLYFWDSVNHSTTSTIAEDGWTVLRSVFTAPDDPAVAKVSLAIRTGLDGWLYTCDYNIRRPKFETGNKATDWSPAPEDTDESISKLSAELSIQAGEIAARVTKTEFDVLGNEVSRQGSEISATPDRIKAAVESVKIGGTNLVRCGDGTITIMTGAIDRNWSKSAYCQSGVGIIFQPFASTYNGTHFYTDVTVEPGQYMLSFWSWTSGAIDAQPIVRCNLYNGEAGIDHYFKDIQPPKSTPTRFEIPVTVDYQQTVNLRLITWTKWTTGSLYFSDVKLEKGTKATDWSPAPEDTDAAISKLSAEMVVQAGEITANATKIETVNQAAGKAQTTANAAQGTANDAVTRVTTAEQRISAVEGAITTKVSKGDFDALGRLVSAQETKIEQTDEQVLILAGRTVGGTNLLRNTETLKKANYSFNNSSDASAGIGFGSTTEDEYGGFRVVCKNQNVRIEMGTFPVTPGQTYAMSAQYKINSGSAPIQFQYVFRNSAGTGLHYWDSVNHSQVGTRVEDGWTVMTSVFTVPDNAAITTMKLAIRTGKDNTAYTCDYNIRRPKLEAGSMPTDWTPSPYDPSNGLDTGANSSVKVRITPDTFDVDVPGTDGDFTLNRTGARIPIVNADIVHAQNLAYRYNGPNTLYVNPNATSAQLAAGNYYRSLVDACAALSGRYLEKSVTITVQGATYGDAYLRGVTGYGSVTIAGGDNSLYGSLSLLDNTAEVWVNNLKIVRTGTSQTFAGRQYGMGWARWYQCVLDGNGGTQAMLADRGAKFMIWDTDLYNATRLLQVSHNADASCVSLRGGGGTHFFHGDGGRVTWSNTRPDGTQSVSNPCLMAPDNLTGIAIDYGAAQPSVPVISTASWSYLYSDSYAGAWGKPGTDAAQGVIRTDSSGTTAAIYGTIWFDAAAIRSALSGKTIKQVSLRLTMLKGYGRETTVSVQLYGTNTAYSGRSGQPQLVTSYGTIGTTEPGAVSEITIPTAAISDIVNGTIQALVLKSDDSELYKDRDYSKNYARLAGSATADGSTCPRLTVVYQ